MNYRAILSDKYYLSENEKFLLLKFELELPYSMSFAAGQYVSLKVNDKGERRSYSIVNTPDNQHGFSLLAEMVEGGKGTSYLRELKPGERVEVVGPLGKFIITEPQDSGTTKSKRLFVATGSGIVPVWSMINDLLLNKKVTTPVRLHWGMRSVKDLFWMDNLERLAETHPNFVYDVVLSQPGSEWSMCQGHVQDCLLRDFGEKGLGDWEGYVCGNPGMVGEVRELLEKLGMKQQLIFSEKFA